MINEFEIISKYFSKLSKNNKGAFNLRDDIFYDSKNKISISVDTYNEKIHFLNFNKPDLIIRKCLRSSLSDLICKGVNPKYYFISASGNKSHFSKLNLKKISAALNSEQKKYSIKLSGGDTVYSKNLSFTFVVVGHSDKLPVLRSGSRLNDDIYVTNTIGDPYLGLYFIKKRSKTKRSKYFINSFYKPNIPITFSKKINLFASASIDISDGLYQDLNHLFFNSKLSYNLSLDKIPISRNLQKYMIIKKLQKSYFVNRGDDYQILFTANKKYRPLIQRIARKSRTLVTKIGVVISGKPKIYPKMQGYIHKF